MSEIMERELSWDDVIENDGSEYITLPEGDYDFKVTNFNRARHPGSAKLPPCNKAVIDIAVETPEGTAVIRHNLFLHSKCEGLLCAFFTAIGQRQHGEKLHMNWNTVVGSTGRCKVGIRRWTGNDGKEHESNEIKRFYEPDLGAKQKPAFTPGAF